MNHNEYQVHFYNCVHVLGNLPGNFNIFSEVFQLSKIMYP